MEPLGPSLRRASRREHPLVRVAVALAISLALNFIFLWQVDSSFLGVLGKADLRPVELSSLSKSQWEANRAVRPPEDHGSGGTYVDLGSSPAQPEPPVKSAGTPAKASQAARNDSQARFKAERDSKVEKETVSRYADERYQVFNPVPVAPTVVPKSGEEGKSEEHRDGGVGQKPGGAPMRLALALPGSGRDQDVAAGTGDGASSAPAAPGAPASLAPAPGLAGAGEGGLRLKGRYDPRLATSPALAAQILAGPKPLGLDEVEEGVGTYLNARADRFATFISRLGEGVGNQWKPGEAYDLRDPDGTIFPARNWKTVVLMTVASTGYLTETKVVKASGLDFLDRAAVDAIKDAQPFLNVPAGLPDRDGQFRLLYSFTVSVEKSGTARVGTGWRRY